MISELLQFGSLRFKAGENGSGMIDICSLYSGIIQNPIQYFNSTYRPILIHPHHPLFYQFFKLDFPSKLHPYFHIINSFPFYFNNQFIYKRFILHKMQAEDNQRSRSGSKRKKKEKKNKDKQRDYRQRRQSSNSLDQSDKYIWQIQKSEKKRKNKDKVKSKKNKSRSRERSRQKKKNKDRNRDKQRKKSRSLSSQKSNQKKKGKINNTNEKVTITKEKEQVRQKVESPKREITQIERAKKFAMRQVKARLLKFNGLYGDDSEESQNQGLKKKINQNFNPGNASQKNQTKINPPNFQSSGAPIQSQPKPTEKKRQSKWGKSSSNESNILMVRHQQPSVKQPVQSQNPQSRLQIDNHDDQLKLSQDKSIQIEEHATEQNNQEEVDPLDQYMNQIEAEAVPQMDLPKKGEKGKVITFEDVVTQAYVTNKNEMRDQNEGLGGDDFKKKFLQAFQNIEQSKANQDKKGTMMENNEQKESDFSDFKQQGEEELDFFAKQRKMAERKQLAQVDHSKIQYEEVTFNLYRQAEQIRDMDQKLVTKFRKQAGDIKIRGKGILNPVFNWYHCGFSDGILSVIEKNNFQKPFPIQAQSIPVILSGRDVIGIAETGSGKTFAYLLPMLKHVSAQRPCEQGDGPIGIIMTPTRQLANQVFMEAKKFCKQTRIRVIAVYGGLPIQKQLSDLKKGAQIIICTPGRMIDILTLNKGKISNLRRVTMLVIDEADRMFDLGFQPQITRIVDNVRPHRQTVMFSATFPKNVENLARRILTNPVEILVGSRGQACRNVEQIVEVRQQTSKFLRLLQILGNWNEKGSILIFIDKQTEADFLYQELLKYGYDSLVLHGAMDPTDREFTIYDFKKGIKTIMIATSVCARGLDIKQIVLVINFKCPNHLEDYIHRIGRTGRAGNKGTAVTFITPQQEQYSIDLIKALEMSEIHPPEELIKMSQQYLKKVKKGEARKIRNRNIQGVGFKFDKEEEQKTSQIKDMLKKQLKNEGLGGFEDSDDDDIETKKKKEEELRGRNQQERVVEAIKNPQIKNKLLNEAVKAVSEAINKGSALTTQKLLQIAVGSMKQSITKHKVITSVDDGVEQVTKLINSFQSKGNGQGIDYFSYDFEINDYPAVARQRACSQHFLNQIQRQNNCTISLRGVEVEHGKKAPVGCRKLYLHIQSEDKSYVQTAYKDIKKVIEENAYENMHMSAMGKYTI